MRIPGTDLHAKRLPAPLPIWHGSVDREAWLSVALAVAEGGGRLLSLWGDGNASRRAVNIGYAMDDGLLWLRLPLQGGADSYPDLSPTFPAAQRMQRALHDLAGIAAEQAADQRPWLNHGAWTGTGFPGGAAPMQQSSSAARPPVDYPFVRVEGEGVHEIAVGPVHAGIIEPGHFRFSVVGEKVLRLEQRLGYTHKGVDRRFTEMAPLEAYRLAGRVCGDSTVAYAWAYCMALESIANCDPPQRAQWLRALMLERERVANHLGDLGALGNDAALGFALAQFSRLREDWQRMSKELFGHRLMMDAVVPGGVACDLSAAGLERLGRQCDAIERELRGLRTIFDDHAGLSDRFIHTGQIAPALARQLGLTGLAGRASGQARDLRCDHPFSPYAGLDVKMATHQNGDVAARVALRFEEALESLRLIRAMVFGLPPGPTRIDVALPTQAARGAGWVEGWRGEILVALEIAGDGDGLLGCHCHDPSWHNWPVLEHAVIGNIVPDFPLINKSFNLSYSGHDR
jgi:Ni,Fe-hydrogenase III large subunit/Ni,Fe-hydrogenase III component G